ncbi:MAG TPA: hydrogenase expression/formation protein [Chromatiales bacterium]|nr:hydrogenase expression/formation protein [Chromatiales bacterium]
MAETGRDPFILGGNARALLHEILHALERLAEEGENTLIDLDRIPFGQDDEAMLKAVLGDGEISVTLDAMGVSHIRETGVRGVWIIEHLNGDKERIGRFIEVTRCPELLRTPGDDLKESCKALKQRLDQ